MVLSSHDNLRMTLVFIHLFIHMQAMNLGSSVQVATVFRSEVPPDWLPVRTSHATLLLHCYHIYELLAVR